MALVDSVKFRGCDTDLGISECVSALLKDPSSHTPLQETTHRAGPQRVEALLVDWGRPVGFYMQVTMNEEI